MSSVARADDDSPSRHKISWGSVRNVTGVECWPRWIVARPIVPLASKHALFRLESRSILPISQSREFLGVIDRRIIRCQRHPVTVRIRSLSRRMAGRRDSQEHRKQNGWRFHTEILQRIEITKRRNSLYFESICVRDSVNCREFHQMSKQPARRTAIMPPMHFAKTFPARSVMTATSRLRTVPIQSCRRCQPEDRLTYSGSFKRRNASTT